MPTPSPKNIVSLVTVIAVYYLERMYQMNKDALRKKLKLIIDLGYPWDSAVKCWNVMNLMPDAAMLKEAYLRMSWSLISATVAGR